MQFCKDVDSVRFSNKRLHKEFRSNVRYGPNAVHSKDGLAIQTLGLNMFDKIGFILTHNWQVMKILIKTLSFEKFMAYKSTNIITCLLYTSPSPRDKRQSRMPSSA